MYELKGNFKKKTKHPVFNLKKKVAEARNQIFEIIISTKRNL